MIIDETLKEYQKLVLNKKEHYITGIYCLHCVNASLKYLENNTKISESEIIKMAQAVYDTWLDTDIQISKISDIICEHWEEYKKKRNFNVYYYCN